MSDNDDVDSFLESFGDTDSVELGGPVTPAKVAVEEEGALDDFLTLGTPDRGLSKPWMKFHRFTLVKTVEEVIGLVDRALVHGRCGLDLETEGFDNRIEYDPQGRPYTIHKIVGYCVSVKGHGYYIPIRHRFNPKLGEQDPNVPVERVDAEIRRLCQASQPILTEEGVKEDPLGSSKIAVPPKVVVYFWNSKFDQEFLYPVTGIDFWHPSSFEDGMLAAYAAYSDDSLGLKEHAERNLTIYDPDRLVDGKPAPCKYEMIKFDELFEPGIPRSERKFYDLYPVEGSAEVLYGCSDAICTEILCEIKGKWDHTREGLSYQYNSEVEKATGAKFGFTYRLEKQVTQSVRDLERNRVKIDKAKISDLLVRAEAELEKYAQLIIGLAERKGFKDFNPASTAQLSKFLFEEEGLNITPKPKKNEASGQYKTDAATLELMAAEPDAPEVLNWIVKHRQIDKIKGTYLANMLNNCDALDQLRFKFVQTGAATGRFTAPAGEPDHGYGGVPPQGIPSKVDKKKPEVAQSLRSAFVPRTGYTILKVDYAGQELRIVTNLSGEIVWITEFQTGTGDLHTITAKAFFGPHITKANKTERDMGKVANFALIYGGGPQAIQRATKCDKVEAARRKANFDKSVPIFAGWVKGQHAVVKKNLGVMTAFKRFIAIPDAAIKPGDKDHNGVEIPLEDVKKIRAACERKSTNFPIQGSGADILKISLVKLIKEFHKRGWRRNGGDDSVRMIMTVHDEIVFEIKHERIPEAVPVILEAMESPSKMVGWKIPLVAEALLGLTWDAKYDWREIHEGKQEVPPWLEGILVPGKTPEPSSSPPPASGTPSPQEPTPQVSSGPTKGTMLVATFAIPVRTKKSVDLVLEAVAGCLDPDQKTFLCLLDSGGQVLIDPAQRISVTPDRFKMKLADKNLGSGDFDLRELPL